MGTIPRNWAKLLFDIGDSILLPGIGVMFVSHFAYSASGHIAYYYCYDRKENVNVSSDNPSSCRAVLIEKYFHRLSPSNDLNPF